MTNKQQQDSEGGVGVKYDFVSSFASVNLSDRERKPRAHWGRVAAFVQERRHSSLEHRQGYDSSWQINEVYKTTERRRSSANMTLQQHTEEGVTKESSNPKKNKATEKVNNIF